MKCIEFWELLKQEGFDFFTGIPDSTFKSWMSFLDDRKDVDLTNLIASNECEAVAIASGYHLATGKIGVIYLQNSGLGKAVNPLTSLADREVYSIPLLLLIGWRGEPEIKDEPQHKKMGRIMIPLLDVLEIPHELLPLEIEKAITIIKKAKDYMISESAPYALIVQKNTFAPYTSQTSIPTNYGIMREEIMKEVLNLLKGKEVIFSTTGKTSRELFEVRIARNEFPHDFYTVGSMGCSPSIALGFALNSKLKTIVFDGDGALIMQMGSLATIGHYKPKNFYHILIDNHAHESTGGQPTVSRSIDFEKICLANGYNFAKTVQSKENLIENITQFLSQEGPAMLIIKSDKGSRENLGRPTTSPLENKKSFIEFYNRQLNSKK